MEMVTKNLYAYYLFAKNDKNEEISLPMDFLLHIYNLPFKDRWDAEFGVHSSPVTISKPSWEDGFKGDRYFYGNFVEVRYIEKLDLIDLNGDEETIKIPQDKGEKMDFSFIFCPKKQIALVEMKGRGCENKINNFFSRHWERYKKNNPDKPTLWIESQAITIEDNARAYLKDRSVSNIQLAVDCSKINSSSTIFPLISQLLGDEDAGTSQLVLNVSVSTVKRGVGLPSVTMSHVVDIIEQLEKNHALKSASCKEMIEHRRSTRLTKLVDIHLRKGVIIEKDESKVLKEELDNLIGELDEV